MRNSSHQQVVERLAFGAAADFQLVQLVCLAAVALGEGGRILVGGCLAFREISLPDGRKDIFD